MVALRFAILLFSIQVCIAQNPVQVQKLTQKISEAKSDSDRIVALGNLAEYYYIFRLESKADSILQHQLNIAELTHNKNLIYATLFGKSVLNISPWSSTETFNRALKFIQQGLDFAIEAGRDDYIALAYIRKANLLRKRGEYNSALQQATLAFSAIGDQQLDSIKALLYLELGDIYKDKRNGIDAYNNFTNAISLAEHLQNVPLQSEVYHHLAELYFTIDYRALAKDNILKSLELNTANKNIVGIANDYIDLARFTDEKVFFEKALIMSDSSKSERQILQSKNIMLAYLMVIEKSAPAALAYLQTNRDLNQYYKNQGEATYLYNIGNIYKYSNVADSALHYYKLAEPGFESDFDIRTRRSVYREMAECYILSNQPENAIAYFEKALALAKKIGEFGTISTLTKQLSKLYAQTANYQKAYEYTEAFLRYEDSLKQSLDARNLVLLEVKRDEEKKAKEEAALAAKTLRKKNIQYMAITIAIAVIFLGMILLGMFPISKVTIKILSFFAFICLFEFIVLLIDSFLHDITHGEPLKIWLIKIFLIALLVPIQHFLEHSVAKFLASQKLLALRKQFTLKHWWQTIKKSTSKKEADFESDTAVL